MLKNNCWVLFFVFGLTQIPQNAEIITFSDHNEIFLFDRSGPFSQIRSHILFVNSGHRESWSCLWGIFKTQISMVTEHQQERLDSWSCCTSLFLSLYNQQPIIFSWWEQLWLGTNIKIGHKVNIGDFSWYKHSKRRRLCAILPVVVPIDDEHKEACTQMNCPIMRHLLKQIVVILISWIVMMLLALKVNLRPHTITDEFSRDNEGIFEVLYRVDKLDCF